jgi:hypothetical protein
MRLIRTKSRIFAASSPSARSCIRLIVQMKGRLLSRSLSQTTSCQCCSWTNRTYTYATSLISPRTCREKMSPTQHFWQLLNRTERMGTAVQLRETRCGILSMIPMFTCSKVRTSYVTGEGQFRINFSNCSASCRKISKTKSWFLTRPSRSRYERF